MLRPDPVQPPDLDQLRARKLHLEREIASREAARRSTRILGGILVVAGGAVTGLAATSLSNAPGIQWTWSSAVALGGTVVLLVGLGLLTRVRFPTDELHDERRRLISRLRRPGDPLG